MEADPLEPNKTVAKSAIVRVAGLDGFSVHPRSYAG
jgi:hypothetical protein